LKKSIDSIMGGSPLGIPNRKLVISSRALAHRFGLKEDAVLACLRERNVGAEENVASESLEVGASRSMLGTYMKPVLASLERRQRRVIELKFGLDPEFDGPLNDSEIGRVEHRSRSWAKPLIDRALRKMREGSRRKALVEYRSYDLLEVDRPIRTRDTMPAVKQQEPQPKQKSELPLMTWVKN